MWDQQIVNKKSFLLRLLIGCKLSGVGVGVWGEQTKDLLEVELAEVQSSEREIDKHQPEGLKPQGDSCLFFSGVAGVVPST